MTAASKGFGPWLAIIVLVGTFGGPGEAQAYYDRVFRDGFDPAYYVAANSGSDSSNGSRQNPWKTINRAVKNANGAPAGATVYVAPGTYQEAVVFARNDLSLIGYQNTPGDQPPILADVPVDTSQIVANSIDAFPPFDPTQMPLVLGADRAVSMCVDLTDVTGITIKNLNIRNCKYGFYAGKSSRTLPENHYLFNANALEMGPTNGDYGGFAICFGMLNSVFANSNFVDSSLIINSSSEGLAIKGYENLARNVKVYSTSQSAGPSTDYYVIIYGDRNRVEHSLGWRLPGVGHIGHGFTIKDNAPDPSSGGSPTPPTVESHDNVFANNVAYNMGGGFVARHKGVTDNLFIDNVAYGTWGEANACTSGNNRYWGSTGITIRDGASNNTFVNMRAYNVCEAIEIEDTIEDGWYNADIPDGNKIIGFQAEGSKTGISYTYCPYSNSNSACPSGQSAGQNEIEDSVFLSTTTIFNAEINASAMTYKNTCFQGLGSSGAFRSGSNASTITPSQFTNARFVDINNYPTTGGWPAQASSCDN